jgi:CYTH domain-containing protein
LRQGYPVIGKDSCVRIRCTDSGKVPTDGVDEKKYVQEIKKGSGLKRLEVPISLSKNQFDTLWPTTEGARITKTRVLIPLKSGHTAELDFFEETLTGFKMVEVEFKTEEEALAFIAPDWFDKEVTYAKECSNLSLALHGLPEGLTLSDGIKIWGQKTVSVSESCFDQKNAAKLGGPLEV